MEKIKREDVQKITQVRKVHTDVVAKRDIKCPDCQATSFLAETKWEFTQKFEANPTGRYPAFLDIVKRSKTITTKVTCDVCGRVIPKTTFKHWHLDQKLEY